MSSPKPLCTDSSQKLAIRNEVRGENAGMTKMHRGAEPWWYWTSQILWKLLVHFKICKNFALFFFTIQYCEKSRVPLPKRAAKLWALALIKENEHTNFEASIGNSSQANVPTHRQELYFSPSHEVALLEAREMNLIISTLTHLILCASQGL